MQVSGRSKYHVWWYGWLTALSTGLGAVPMIWYKDVSEWWLGVGNAVAAGMMTAASAPIHGMKIVYLSHSLPRALAVRPLCGIGAA